MDQSVAIQETLVEGEYCIIISFPAVSSQLHASPGFGKWNGRCLSLSHQGKKETSIYYVLTWSWTLYQVL